MINNDVLRRLRFALDLKDSAMIEIFALSNQTLDEATIIKLLKKEDAEGYLECPNELMRAFLDGLIIYKRGPNPNEKKPDDDKKLLSNNMMLRKIRIALDIKEQDMLHILMLAGVHVSKHELSALFRRAGHKNFRVCGDQFLRNFLKGLAKQYRKPSKAT